MPVLLGGLAALITATWIIDLTVAGPASGGSLPWVIRQEAMYLSGLLSVVMMSLAMFLASRPGWLEPPLGGLDRMYRAHKWAGILGVGFAAAHWLIEMSDDILKTLVGRAGRMRAADDAGLLGGLHDLAEGAGEWAIYALLLLLAVTLWKRIPYRWWRSLHRAMPIVYLLCVLHAIVLAPAQYWGRPLGILLLVLLGAGAYGSVLALAGRIGRARQASGTITAIERPTRDVVTVRCRVDSGWRAHRPGQFALVGFDEREGTHPFTIASADHGDRSLCFHIKALGDYTRRLPDRLTVGQQVRIEGPYGRFDLTRLDRRARQVWIAGGIGVTPFLAWLEALQPHPEQGRADLHYWTRNPETDPFVSRLAALCAPLPGIRLHTHSRADGEVSDTVRALANHCSGHRAEFWYCGPPGLAARLKQELSALGVRGFRFHQEAFELR